MKGFFKKLASGFVIGLGLCLAILTVAGIEAATIPTISGPVSPSGWQAYLNQVINNINTTLAPGGSGTMASFLTILSTGEGQLVSTSSWSTTTSTKCSFPGGPTVSLCLLIEDTTGTQRYIPVF